MGMSANLDQCFNHPFKCIHLIIPYDQLVMGSKLCEQFFVFCFPGACGITKRQGHHTANVMGEKKTGKV
jgi:hypothetical protein